MSRKLFYPQPKQTYEWETAFEAIEGVTRVGEDDLARLQKLLSDCDDEDSYLTSPIYYTFTGRKGLWVYEKDGGFLFVCWHPNVPNQILIFPQIIKHDTDLITDILLKIPEPAGGVRIVRVKKNAQIRRGTLSHYSPSFTLRTCEEDVLDWKYPVHLLSTEAVTVLVGHQFMYIRNRLRQLKIHSVNIVPYDAILYSRALENLLHRWATHNATNQEEYDNLYAPYENLFSLSMEKISGLSGLMFFVDDTLQAVSLWDVSNASRKTANLFVNICNTEIRGLSELLTVKSCETLQQQGVARLNLGGSEWAGLDTYKRKFCPVTSVELHSANVQYDVSAQRLALSEKRRYA